MRKIHPSVTAAIASVALLVGALSFVGGVLNQRAADRKVCHVVKHTNAAVRGLIDDLIVPNQKVTRADRKAIDSTVAARFPDAC